MQLNKFYTGDCRKILPTLKTESVQCVVTSPPYYKLRDYGVDGQIGQEQTPEEYINNLVQIFREIKRILKSDGTVWLNLGDSYSGSNKGRNIDGSRNYSKKSYKDNKNKGRATGILKPTRLDNLPPKNLIGIPWRVAFALQADGWYLRQDIIWQKPNCMPEAVQDRCTNNHKYIFLLAKNKKYYFDYKAIEEKASSNEKRLHSIIRNRELGYNSKENKLHGNTKKANKLPEKYKNYDLSKRRKRSVWTVHTKPYPEAHFATFPPELIQPCILAGSKPKDIILDPFFGSGTTGEVSTLFNRYWIGIDINSEYEPLHKQRLGLFSEIKGEI